MLRITAKNAGQKGHKFQKVRGSDDEVLAYLAALHGPKRLFVIGLSSFDDGAVLLVAEDYDQVAEGGEQVPKRFTEGIVDQQRYDYVGQFAIVDGKPVMTITTSAVEIDKTRLHNFALGLQAALFESVIDDETEVEGDEQPNNFQLRDTDGEQVLTLVQPVEAKMVATTWSDDKFVFMDINTSDEQQQIRFGFEKNVLIAAEHGSTQVLTLTADQIDMSLLTGTVEWEQALQIDQAIEMIGQVDGVGDEQIGAILLTVNQGTYEKPEYGYVPVTITWDEGKPTFRAGAIIEADPESGFTTIATLSEEKVTNLDLNGARNIFQRDETGQVPVAKTLWQGLKDQTTQTAAVQ